MSRPSLGGVVATRQGALLLAVVCALAATAVLLFALSRYRAGIKHTVPQSTVLVATAGIAKGTTGSEIAAQGLYKSMPVDASTLTPGAITDASQIASEYTTQPILAGAQLTAADFTTTPGVSGLLLPDERAIAMTITESPGAQDVLQQGDHVDVYAQLKSGTIVLLEPDLQVLKTVALSVGGPGKTASNLTGSSLVLKVTSKQASDLVWGIGNATLYLSLLPSHNPTASPRSVTNAGTVLRDSVAVSHPQNGAHR